MVRYGQETSQGWSQPVRNDEVPQPKKSFFGKGPKGFKRSDERISEDCVDAVSGVKDVRNEIRVQTQSSLEQSN